MRQTKFEKGPHSLVTARYASSFAFVDKFVGWTGVSLAGLESSSVRQFRPIRIVLAVCALIGLGLPTAAAQPRSAAAPRQAPALPESGHQTEAIDLNEGKTAAQMFASDCAVCHQRPNGLAKGRSAGQVTGFLRQHYTTGTQHAGMLAAYLTSGGMDRGAPAPAAARDGKERPAARDRTPADRSPAAIGARRPSEADDATPDAARGEGRRKPATAIEASKPADHDPAAGRRKPPAERTPAASTSKPAASEVKQSEAPAAPAPETPTAVAEPAVPPAEEKPAAPPPPPVPEIRI